MTLCDIQAPSQTALPITEAGVDPRHGTWTSCDRLIGDLAWSCLTEENIDDDFTQAFLGDFLQFFDGRVLVFPRCVRAGAPRIAAARRRGPLDHRGGVESHPWDTIQWVERRYKIEAIRFKARDETGFDWPGSDEVMVQTNDAKGLTVSNEIGDIDSGDTHNFDPAKSCIVAVRPGVVVLGKSSVCDEVGEPAPLSFQVEFWEKDFGLPPYGFQVPPGRQGRGNMLGRGGRTTNMTTMTSLAAPRLTIRRRTLRPRCFMSATKLSKPSNWTPAPAGSAPATPTTPLPGASHACPTCGSIWRSELNEAMRRSGARSELEVIATGLRYLRAPKPAQDRAERSRSVP